MTNEARSVPDLCQTCGHGKRSHRGRGSRCVATTRCYCNGFVPASPALPEPPHDWTEDDGVMPITHPAHPLYAAPALPVEGDDSAIFDAWATLFASVGLPLPRAFGSQVTLAQMKVERAVRADERRVAEERIAEVRAAVAERADDLEEWAHAPESFDSSKVVAQIIADLRALSKPTQEAQDG